jgi:hypothetical protein
MKLDLIRSNQNPVHVSVFQDISLNPNDWNVVPLTTLMMPIRIWRITFNFQTDIDSNFIFYARLVRGTENLLIVGNNLGSIFSQDNHVWVNCLVSGINANALNVQLNMYATQLTDFGLSNFDSVDIYPVPQGASPNRVDMYIGWSFR